MGAGLVSAAFAQAQPAVTGQQQMDPRFRTTVTADVIENNNQAFRHRVLSELVERPAPQVGQTRAAIEAVYGPARSELAPGREYDIYTNELDLVDGKMFRRQLSENALRIYEVSYSAGATRTANDKATDIKQRVIPRIGDHRNLVDLMLGRPYHRYDLQEGQRAVYGIPKQRFVYYNDVISSPFTAANMYFNNEGFLVGQEFMPSRMQGWHTLTTAGRYVDFPTRFQPDRRVGR
jgi:hypothetical protein